MAKETKTAKLTEDVLQEQPLDQAQTPAPTQATPEEVNQASADLSDPSLADPDLTEPTEDISSDDLVNEVSTDATIPAQEDPMFTPPAPGYVPAGWVKIEDLASAVAQATGDVTAAETAPDAQAPSTTPEVPAEPTTPSEAITEPLVQQPEAPQQPGQQPVQESTENTKERLTEDIDLVNAGNTDEVPPMEANTTIDTKLKESQKLNEEMILDGEEVAEPLEDIPEEPEESDISKETLKSEEDLPEDLSEEEAVDEDYEFPEDIQLDTEDEDFLAKITSFLDEVKDDAEDKMEDAEDDVEEAADSFESTSNFLRSLLDDDEDPNDEDDDFEDDDDLEMEEPEDDFEDDPDEEDFEDDEEEDDMGEEAYDESYRNSRPHMKENVKYNSFLPSGSEHFAAGDNIVKSYEESSAARRRAIANFRASLKENKVRDSQLRRRNSLSRDRFSEALRGESFRESYRERESFRENSSNSNSWGYNNMLNKYEEGETLNWKELLNKGFLG